MFVECFHALGATLESWSPQPGALVARAFLRREGDFPVPSPETDTFETLLCVDGQLELTLPSGALRSVSPGEVLLCAPELALSRLSLPQDHAVVYAAVIPVERLETYYRESTGAQEAALEGLRENLLNASGCWTLHSSDWYASVSGVLSHLDQEQRGGYVFLRLLERLWLASSETYDRRASSSVSPTQADLVRRVRRYLMDHLDNRLTIDSIAAEFHISPTYLKEAFRRVSGQPVHHYLQECRLTKAARLLSTTEDSVLSIAVGVGYSGASRFNAAFKERYGVSPRQYRENAVK